jgi:hypothetical protein
MTTQILAQPHTVAPTRPIYRIRCDGLSAEARAYLRAQVAKQLKDGTSKREAAAWANAWATGYRALQCGTKRSLLSEIALDGLAYAEGEQAWLDCLYIDACQDSAAACGYPSVNWG